MPLLFLGLFALFGFFLVRGGVTGFAVAGQCDATHACPDVSASIQGPSYMPPEDSNALSVVGLLIIIISVSLVFGYLEIKKVKEKQVEGQITQQLF